MNESLKALKKIIKNIKQVSERCNKIYEKCQKIDSIDAVGLLMLYHEIRISDFLRDYYGYLFADEVQNFKNKEQHFDDVWEICEFDIKTPQYFINSKDEAMNISFTLEASNFFANMYNNNEITLEKLVNNPDLFNYLSNISEKINYCKKLVGKTIEERENAEVIDFDDKSIHDLANQAILRAYKYSNVNECSLQMDEIREAVIDIFHKDLYIYDTNNITTLYDIGLQRLEMLNNKERQITQECQNRKLIKK